MKAKSRNLQHLIDQAMALEPIHVAVVDAAQGVVIETLREAHAFGFIEPRMIGDPDSIGAICKGMGWKIADDWIVPASTDTAAAAKAVELARNGEAEAIMKGDIHTDAFMRALLDKDRGLRVPGRRVSHVFIAEVSTYPKLLGITRSEERRVGKECRL